MIIDRNNIKYSGRFDFSLEDQVSFAWTGTSLEINFCGYKVGAELESTGDDYFVVILDGRVINNCLKIGKRQIYNLVEGISNGEHNLILFKRTEAFVGTTTFYGFDLFGGSVLKKSPCFPVRIEVIGDSISCGYGNEAENQFVEFNAINGNSYYSYSAMTARILEAELHITSWSGLGLIRNYDDSPMPLPERLDWITPNNLEQKWDFRSWIPDVLIINLGTNDFNGGFIPAREAFTGAYIELIEKMKGYYGDVKVICSVGSIVEGKALEVTREYVKNGVVDVLNQKGMKDIYFLEFEHQKEENGYGENFHPSIKTHELMANQLVDKIKSITGW